MNMKRQDIKNLESSLAVMLEKILATVPWLSAVDVTINPADYDRAFDLQAKIGLTRGNKIELWVDCKDMPRPSRFPYVSLQQQFGKNGSKTVRVRSLAAPYISPRMAEMCEKHGWSWFDLAGNCRITVPELLHIERSGNKPVHSRPKREGANLSTHESARILRVLMAPEHAGRRWTQRELQDACDPKVSLGKVNALVSYLREQAYLIDQKGGGLRMHDYEGLLKEWRGVYAYEEHRQLNCFSLSDRKSIFKKLAELGAGSSVGAMPACLASFTAADELAPHVRQSRLWVYCRAQHTREIQKLLGAKEVDTGANLILLEAADEGVFEGIHLGKEGVPTTSALQSYLDLWQAGGRGEEAATAILNQCLRPAWEKGQQEE
jgi:hypothetical protein